jgi:hypothetical protein
VAVAVALASVLLGASACGAGSQVLDPSELDASVSDAVAQGLGVEGDQVAVACPDAVPLQADRRTTCAVEVEELGALEATVVQVDDKGAVEVELGAALIDRAEVAASLRATLREELGRSFQVDCGDDPAELVPVGDTFPCRARDADSRRSVDVTVVDGTGAVSFEILRPGA